jgi:hypothetical protein
LNWNWATNNSPLPGSTNPVESTPEPEPTTMIPFRQGLTQKQKDDITALYGKDPSTWTETDILNWNWATNNAARPTAEETQTEPTSLIPFRDGLSDAQKNSITTLSNKPISEWTPTDKLNWKWATNDAPMPGSTEDVIPEETPELTDLFDGMINVDPFLTAQLQDPALRAQFDSLDPALKMQYLMNLRALKESIEAGQIINPNLEITPEQATIFENQAKAKVSGYYDELIGYETGDLKTKLERMKEDWTTGVGRAEEIFKEKLGTQAESEAQAGLTFGSERGTRVSKTIKAQQEGLNDAGLEMARSQQDLATQAERKIGSSAFGGLNLDLTSQNYNVGERGFTQTGTRSLFTPAGNLVGEIPKQREVDVINEKNNLILAEKQKRILDNSQLNGNPITDWSSVINTPKVTTPVADTPNITLPNGQVISSGDPNYLNYKKQYNL